MRKTTFGFPYKNCLISPDLDFFNYLHYVLKSETKDCSEIIMTRNLKVRSC